MTAAEIAAACGNARREGRDWRCRCPLHGGRSLTAKEVQAAADAWIPPGRGWGWNQAMLDLGATVFVAGSPRCDECPLAERCPSRGRRYEPLRKQGPFEGSFRQRRADTLRLVAEEARALESLDADAVASLERDGLVATSDGVVRLPV